MREVRALASARLLALGEGDVGQLAPLLELVQQLASQRRRDRGVVEHLLGLLRTPRGLAAIQEGWNSLVPAHRRAALRFSWEASPERVAVLRAAMESRDAVVRCWAADMLSASGEGGRAEALHRLARDPLPRVATAALDALDRCLEPPDRELLRELRCAASPGLQHTARFMLKKHFGEESGREVYLALLERRAARSQVAAAIGLTATGESQDHRALLSARMGARSKVRQRLLGAAAGLDPSGSRGALFEDLAHELGGVSKGARKLLAERVRDTDAGALSELLDNPRAHVRKNAVVLAARLSHWLALPFILRGTRDPDDPTANTANTLLVKWFARHFHGVYLVPEPSEAQARAVRSEMVACGEGLGRSATAKLQSALAGEHVR